MEAILKSSNASGVCKIRKRVLSKRKKIEKAFAEKGTLMEHRPTHMGEMPHKCDQCDKAFSNKADLKKHYRTHTGEKPYKCDQCEKAFAEKSNLRRHLRTLTCRHERNHPNVTSVINHSLRTLTHRNT